MENSLRDQPIQNSPSVNSATSSVPSSTVQTTTTETVVTQPPFKKPSQRLPKFLLVVSLLILFIGLAFYLDLPKQLPGQVANSPTPTAVANFATPTATPEPLLQNANSEVTWQAPEKVQNVGFFKILDTVLPFKIQYCADENCTQDSIKYLTVPYEPKTTYYLVGKMNSIYPDSNVFLAITKGLPNDSTYKGIGQLKDLHNDETLASLFIKTPEGRFIVTDDYQDDTIMCQQYSGVTCQYDQLASQLPDITYRKQFYLDEIGSKQQYIDASQKIDLSLGQTNEFFNDKGLFLVKDLGKNYLIYSTQDPSRNELVLKDANHPKIFMKSPTGLSYDVTENQQYADYTPVPPSPEPGSTYQPSIITWNVSPPPFYSEELAKKNSYAYIQTGQNGFIDYSTSTNTCSASSNSHSDAETYTTSFEKITPATDLTLAGKTSYGYSIYEFNQTDYQIFNRVWNTNISYKGFADLLPYTEYLSSRPIVLFKSPLGLYYLAYRQDLLEQQCYGEPLIYLYPTEKTEVSVNLSNKVKLTESTPPYKTGWTVTAEPTGKLFDAAENRFYPYLYWEGAAPSLSEPISLHVVKKEDVHTYLEKELTQLGLITKERQDFEAYWEPQLQTAPYYSISLFSQTVLDSLVPLHISPKPDTLIRVMMNYKAFSVPPADLNQIENTQPSPARTGFTAVEWGGIIHQHE